MLLCRNDSISKKVFTRWWAEAKPRTNHRHLGNRNNCFGDASRRGSVSVTCFCCPLLVLNLESPCVVRVLSATPSKRLKLVVTADADADAGETKRAQRRRKKNDTLPAKGAVDRKRACEMEAVSFTVFTVRETFTLRAVSN